MRAHLLIGVLVSTAPLACAPSRGDTLDVGGSAATGSCSATPLREVRYATTVAKGTKLRPEIGDRRCVANLYEKLEDDIACAQAFNRSGWEQAFTSHGLVAYEPELDTIWLEQGMLTPGSIHPHPDDPALRVVVLGYQGSGCDGTSRHVQVSPGISLARNRAGQIVVVIPKPTIESRDYATCSCFPGCGAEMEPMPMFAVIPATEAAAEPVELVYPAIAISTHAVENESCCCAA